MNGLANRLFGAFIEVNLIHIAVHSVYFLVESSLRSDWTGAVRSGGAHLGSHFDNPNRLFCRALRVY